jgi:hypothetical protein
MNRVCMPFQRYQICIQDDYAVFIHKLRLNGFLFEHAIEITWLRAVRRF